MGLRVPGAEGLTARQRRALAVPIISRGVKAGLGSESIIRNIEARGITYRRTEMLSDIRFFRDREGTLSLIKRLPPGEVLRIGEIRVRKHIKDERFRYTVRWKETDIATGKTIDKGLTVYSDSLMSQTEMRDFMGPALERVEGYGEKQIDFDSIEYVDVTRRR